MLCISTVWADWFKNDAILDAINLFSLYQANQIKEKTPGDAANLLGVNVWTNTTLERYRNRLGEEGKLVEDKPVKPFSLEVVPQQSLRPPKETTLPFPSTGGAPWKSPDMSGRFIPNPGTPLAPVLPKETPLPQPSPGGVYRPDLVPNTFGTDGQIPDSTSRPSPFAQPSNTGVPYRALFQVSGTQNLDYLLKKSEPQ